MCARLVDYDHDSINDIPNIAQSEDPDTNDYTIHSDGADSLKDIQISLQIIWKKFRDLDDAKGALNMLNRLQETGQEFTVKMKVTFLGIMRLLYKFMYWECAPRTNV